jgi:hypothetical protein
MLVLILGGLQAEPAPSPVASAMAFVADTTSDRAGLAQRS